MTGSACVVLRVALGAFAALASGCGLADGATTRARDWAFIQSVGGLALGEPARGADHRVHLPLACNVSGLEAVATEPTALSSGLSCRQPRVRILERTIALTVVTCVPSPRWPSARCPDADLGHLAPGRYAVAYVDPDGTAHPLGEIDVPAR